MECSEAMDIPNEILLEANAININYLMPKNSKQVYELVFSEWKTERNSGK